MLDDVISKQIFKHGKNCPAYFLGSDGISFILCWTGCSEKMFLTLKESRLLSISSSFCKYEKSTQVQMLTDHWVTCCYNPTWTEDAISLWFSRANVIKSTWAQLTRRIMPVQNGKRHWPLNDQILKSAAAILDTWWHYIGVKIILVKIVDNDLQEDLVQSKGEARQGRPK